MADEIWSDLHQSISADGSGKLKKVSNINSVKTSIDNILGTFKGERMFLPEFASTLRDLLFEPLNDRLFNRVSNDIKATVERWDDRVEIIGVDIKAEPDKSFVQISVNFNVKGYTEAFTHNTTVSQ